MACSTRPNNRDWHEKSVGVGRHAGPMVPPNLVHRIVQLYFGLLFYGLGCALQVRANLGLDPWDVFHQGISRHTGLRIGTVVILVGVAVLLLWWPLRQWPGVGTISNALVVGLAM